MTSYLLPPKKQHKDESEFLELRQRIKESIRMKKKIQNGNAIASPTSDQSKTNHFGLGTKVTSTQSSMFEKKRKVEKLKDSRDYSFLFSDDDAKLPIPRMEPPSRNVPIPISRPSSKEIHSKPDPTRKQDSVLVDQRRKLLTSSDHREQRKVSQELTRSSQKVPRQSLQQANQLKKKKKIVKMSEDDGKALRMVREMFKTNRYAGRDFDDDDECMEANFVDILKEEKRSERLAKKEDAEQQRLIEEEERRERVRKEKKKQKLSH